MNQAQEMRAKLGRWMLWSIAIGVVGIVAGIVGGLLDPAQLFRSYLFGYLFWLSIALGGMAVLMVHHMTGGAWGFVIRRLLEGAAMTLPLMALLFIPLLFGLPHMFSWLSPDLGAESEIQHKSHFFFNLPWFYARAAIYFICWIGIAVLLRRWSLEQDRTGDAGSITRRFQLFCGPGLLIYVLTFSLAAIDWIMALEPHWYSTIFGMIVITSQGLAGLAFSIFIAGRLLAGTELKREIPVKAFHDLGHLLLAFVLLWAYMSYSQYIIIWSGNQSTESLFYIHRGRGGWQYVGLALILVHFFAPFILLLFGALKKSIGILSLIALGVLGAHAIDQFWLIMPSFYTTGFRIHWLDFAAPAGIGGLWFALFCWNVRRHALAPLHDPRLEPHFDASEVAQSG